MEYETRPRAQSSSLEILERIIEDTRKLTEDVDSLEHDIDDLMENNKCFIGVWLVIKKLIDCFMCKK